MEKDEYFEFFVKDYGIVIKSDYFDKIFKVFTKLESTSASSGIGLYIVKKIVTYYRSSIWLESKESVGTTFYFSLPKQQFTFPLFKEI
nr:ATP-binding protein [Polaribacter filamentus]